MRLTLADEQQMIQTRAREFAESEIKPVAEELDREERFPHETVKRLGELGMMGMTIPERWGGSGADAVSLILAIIELAKQCASHAVILTVNNSLYCEPILNYGTDAQRERFLTPCARGEKIASSPSPNPKPDPTPPNRRPMAGATAVHYASTAGKTFWPTGREPSL